MILRTPMAPDRLNSYMQFDCPIRVHGDGSVSETDGVYAPVYMNEALDNERWQLMRGYSRQWIPCRDNATMHNSEFIGGDLARDILATPGLYVAVTAQWSCEECEQDDDCEHDLTEGWAIAFIPEEMI